MSAGYRKGTMFEIELSSGHKQQITSKSKGNSEEIIADYKRMRDEFGTARTLSIVKKGKRNVIG